MSTVTTNYKNSNSADIGSLFLNVGTSGDNCSQTIYGSKTFTSAPIITTARAVTDSTSSVAAIRDITTALTPYATTTSLASYATTASLASYATTASLSSYATTTSGTFSNGIVETSSGMTIGKYIQSNCAQTQTYQFTELGLYMICFTINDDRNTTGSWYVNVLNNVNDGSYVVNITVGQSVSCSINVSTNTITINSVYSGSKLMIHKLFSY